MRSLSQKPILCMYIGIYTYSLDLVHQRCTVTVPVVLTCVFITDLRTATGWEWGGVCCSR